MVLRRQMSRPRYQPERSCRPRVLAMPWGALGDGNGPGGWWVGPYLLRVTVTWAVQAVIGREPRSSRVSFTPL